MPNNQQIDVQLILGRLLHSCEENQKALDRFEASERGNVQTSTELRVNVEQMRKEIDSMSKVIRGQNGLGVVRKIDQLQNEVKVLQQNRARNRKLLAFAASPGLLVLIDRLLAWVSAL